MSEQPIDRRAIPWATRSLSVFVPAFNEVDNLAPTVETIMRALSVSVEDYEVIVVDDGSTDGTYEVAETLADRFPEIRVIHNPRNRGLGYGWMRGGDNGPKKAFFFFSGGHHHPPSPPPAPLVHLPHTPRRPPAPGSQCEGSPGGGGRRRPAAPRPRKCRLCCRRRRR